MTPYTSTTLWHQRFPPLRWLRSLTRKAFFASLARAFQTDDGKAILAASLEGLLQRTPALQQNDARCSPPYPELHSFTPSAAGDGTGAVIITARFRSGSTLLWNLFRNLDGFTSYYEPFNERRWFDPAARGDRLDATHRNVSDYWAEYDGLAELGKHYREEWICRHLCMDGAAWDPDMQRYVETLITSAPGRPVLQFNRIDFRLPWFRRHFPGARIVHLYRHPRDQWCSSLMDAKCFPRDSSVRDFGRHDKFYVMMWAEDLKYHFPFLDERRVTHPYQLFYYIWKLSYLFGRKYSDCSLAFEDLVRDPDTELRRLFAAVDVRVDRMEHLKALFASPPLGKWREYAEDAWFRDHEAACDATMAEWLHGVDAGDIPETLTASHAGRNGRHLNGACSAKGL
jgi:hypothetical protein